MKNQPENLAEIPDLTYDGSLEGLAKSRSEKMSDKKTVDHLGIPEEEDENCAMNFSSVSDDAVARAIM